MSASVVDTSGAGDAFVALAAKLIEGKIWMKQLSFLLLMHHWPLKKKGIINAI